jgi:hypothetical protein
MKIKIKKTSNEKVYVHKYGKYTLILSYDPCSIFNYYKVDKMHGLNLKDCSEYNNTTKDAYIAGWTNIAPDNGKPFTFINLSRCTDDIHTMGLVMHETVHLSNMLFDGKWKDKEEDMITFAEEEAYKIVDIIKKIKK